VRAEDIRLTLNRSAIGVKPKPPFLDWLHAADSTSTELTLQELVLELAIYLIPECDTPQEVADVLHELENVVCKLMIIFHVPPSVARGQPWPPDVHRKHRAATFQHNDRSRKPHTPLPGKRAL
jgi:hypothetical protein